jgi:integrase
VLPRPLYLSFDDEAEGDAYVRRLEAQLDRGVLPDAVMKARDLGSAVARYTSQVAITTDDTRLLAVIVDRLPQTLRLEELTFAWAQAWVTAMKREANLSPSTIRHHVGALSRALNWLERHEELPGGNPLKLLPRGYATYTDEDARAAEAGDGRRKRDTERDRRLEPGEEPEIRRILAGGKPEGRQRRLELHHQAALQLLFDMALESAMRLREMFTLRRDQVDLARSTIFLTRTKNGKRRQVPITTVLRPLLKAYLAAHDFDGRVFPWWDGDDATMKRTTDALSRQWDRIFNAAGAEDLHFHDLRHEAISRIYERTTLTDVEVANITGHTDLRMLKRYANLRGSQLAGKLW